MEEWFPGEPLALLHELNVLNQGWVVSIAVTHVIWQKRNCLVETISKHVRAQKMLSNNLAFFPEMTASIIYIFVKKDFCISCIPTNVVQVRRFAAEQNLIVEEEIESKHLSY